MCVMSAKIKVTKYKHRRCIPFLREMNRTGETNRRLLELNSLCTETEFLWRLGDGIHAFEACRV